MDIVGGAGEMERGAPKARVPLKGFLSGSWG